MENIEDKKFLTRELAIKTLKDWVKEHGKNRHKKNLKNVLMYIGKKVAD